MDSPETSQNCAGIAIAAALLSRRPPYQSMSSYVVRLRTKFPKRTAPLQTDHGWRERAMFLEEQLESLRAERDSKIAELALLHAKPSSAISQSSLKRSSGGSLAQEERPKKKRKAQASDLNLTPVDWEQTLASLYTDDRLKPPDMKDGLGALSALVELRSLSTHSKFKDSTPLVLRIIKSAISALGKTVILSLKQAIGSTQQIQLLSGISTILPLVLEHIVCLFPQSTDKSLEILYPVLELIHQLIFMPIIESMLCLITSRMSMQTGTQVRPTSTISPTKEPCAIFLQICESSLSSLKSLPKLRARLALLLSQSSIKQLGHIRSDSPKQINAMLPGGQPSQDVAARVYRLSIKDALWYYAAIVDLAFSVPLDLTLEEASPIEQAVRAEVIQKLADMIYQKSSGTNSVEKQLLLGIAEKAWLNGWAQILDEASFALDVVHESR